jgi:CHAT domain-containing protein/Flp pilus assembly protein TadD
MLKKALLIFLGCLWLSAYAADSHKQRMIEYVNKGEYAQAAEELPHVENWDFVWESQDVYMNLDSGFEFISLIDTLCVQKANKDSLCSYLAKVSYRIGLNYYKQGLYDQTIPYWNMTSRLRLYLFGEQHPKYANALNNLGLLCAKMGNYTKAEAYFLQALEIRKSVSSEQHLNYAAGLQNLGIVYKEMGDYSKAEACYLKALKITKFVSGEKHPNYAAVLQNLGSLYANCGDYSKAEAYFLRALEIRKSVLGERHPDYANTLNALGVVYKNRSDYSKAEACLLQALEIRKSVLGEQHPDCAITLNNLGVLYSDMSDFSKSEAYFLRALEIRKSVLGERHPDCASTLNSLGVVYKVMGDYSKAETNYLQALEITKSVLDEQHPSCAFELNNLGVLYREMGDYSKAEIYYLQASQLQKNNFLTSLHFMTEQQRQHYWNTMQKKFTNTYPNFSYLCCEMNHSISTFAYDNELFTKGLLLNSSNAIARSIQESNDTALINAFDQLKYMRQMILHLQEKEPQSPHIVEYTERAEQIEKEITKSSVAYRDNQAIWQITWNSVRKHLQKGQVAIEYMVAPLNKDSTMYCALLLRRNSKYPELIPLFEEKDVQSILNVNTENNLYDYDSYGRQISSLVWSKVLPKIKKGETIYFAPSGLLHQLAIEALPYDSTHTMSDVHNMVRLSSTREIVLNQSSNVHSTATLYGGIQYNMEADELLAESEAYSTMNLLASRGIDSDTLNRGSVKYLAGTKREVENINRMLRDYHLQVRLFTSTAANEESFKALSGTHQNILHIATHGFFWPDSTAKKKDFFAERMMRMGDDAPAEKIIDPLSRCGLLFAGANLALQGHSNELPEGVQDGILTAKEISLLDLRDADLVVLSACETGKGEISGDGVFGLQRAFKMAGVQTIIMSLWPVNDSATQMLMTEFYRNWIVLGQPKRTAFRNAQNAVREEFEEPVYWAGFIMLD